MCQGFGIRCFAKTPSIQLFGRMDEMSQRTRSVRGRTIALFSLAVAGTLAAACGDDSSPIAQKVDACTLLKSEDLQRVIGVAFEPAKKGRTAGGGENKGYMSSCTFSTPEKGSDDGSMAELRDALRKAVFVNVMVWSWPSNGKGSENYMTSIAKVKAPAPRVPSSTASSRK